MDAKQLIRQLIDLLNQTLDNYPDSELDYTSNDVNRFKQIKDLHSHNDCGCGDDLANAPDEHYADIDSVTVHAGGGVNGPKHPADIWTDSNRMYPEFKGFKDYYEQVEKKKNS